VVTRRTRYDLHQAKQHREIIEGLGMAVTDVDLVVSTIRQSKDPEEARARLMELPLQGLEEFVRRAGRPEDEITEAKKRSPYRLTERQAKAILEMRLSRLTGLEREKLATEYGELCDLIARLEEILASDQRLREVIVEELEEVKSRYGDGRRTEIVEAEGDISIEDLVADEDVVVTVTHKGYIKRVLASEYRAQGRGGKGTRGMETRDEDFVSYLFVANTHAHVLFLSDKGKAYLKKVYEIPQTGRAARGRAVVNLVGMEAGDRVAAIVPIREFVEDGYLITCTRQGRVKRSPLSAYANIRQTGIIGVAVPEGDELFTARVVGENHEILIGTSHGMSIRFSVDQVRPMGRDSMGVKGIDLREGDRVIGMDAVEDEAQQVLTVSENGYGKRTSLAEWRGQKRGGLGLIGMTISERNGQLVKLRIVSADDQVMVITDKGQIIRTHVAEIRECGRNTQGVRVIRLSKGERVVDVEPIAEAEEEPDGEADPSASEGSGPTDQAG
jgi:DNA gyrase subunit A